MKLSDIRYQIGDVVFYYGGRGVITAILSNDRYQLYLQNGNIVLAHESEVSLNEPKR